MSQAAYQVFIAYFLANKPDLKTELHYENAYQLIVSVILSAQCTDKRVNQETPHLFAAFPTPADLAHGSFEEVYPYIQRISYPNNKTKHLLGMARRLVDHYGGQVPQTVEELQTLPGVGRKTAHVVASVLYDLPVLAVDTHVFRVAKRLGLADATATTPLAVEKQLVAHIPQNLLNKAHHWLIHHGRYTCTARKPKCATCPFTSVCLYLKANTPA